LYCCALRGLVCFDACGNIIERLVDVSLAYYGSGNIIERFYNVSCNIIVRLPDSLVNHGSGNINVRLPDSLVDHGSGTINVRLPDSLVKHSLGNIIGRFRCWITNQGTVDHIQFVVKIKNGRGHRR